MDWRSLPTRLAGRFTPQVFFIAVIGVAAGALITGFRFELPSFGENALAELFGFAAGAAVTYFIIQRLLARERRKQLHQVRETTLASLRRRLDDILFQYWVAFDCSGPGMGFSEPRRSTFEFSSEPRDERFHLYLFDLVVQQVSAFRSHNQGIFSRFLWRGPHGTALSLHKAIKPSVDEILDRIHPRIIEFGDMSSLTESISDLDAANSYWLTQDMAVRLPQRGALYRRSAKPFDASMAFLQRVREVYFHLYRQEGSPVPTDDFDVDVVEILDADSGDVLEWLLAIYPTTNPKFWLEESKIEGEVVGVALTKDDDFQTLEITIRPDRPRAEPSG